MPDKKHFDNVEDQIGYCGIWCGSCVAGNGVLQELTERYDRIIKDYDLEQWASIQNMPLCPGCLKGGGRDDCEIGAGISRSSICDLTATFVFGTFKFSQNHDPDRFDRKRQIYL